MATSYIPVINSSIFFFVFIPGAKVTKINNFDQERECEHGKRLRFQVTLSRGEKSDIPQDLTLHGFRWLVHFQGIVEYCLNCWSFNKVVMPQNSWTAHSGIRRGLTSSFGVACYKTIQLSCNKRNCCR